MTEKPTQIQPTAPTQGAETVDPAKPAHGGPPGEPPYLPPTGGGGGGGNGEEPEQPDDSVTKRLGIIAILLAVAAVILLFLLLNQADDERPEVASTPAATQAATPTSTPTETATATPAATSAPGGAAVPDADAETQEEETGPLLQAGKVTKIDAKQGDSVSFRVTSKTDDVIHVHGYDLEESVPAGETIVVTIPDANIAGIFEIEFHETGEQIGELTVNP